MLEEKGENNLILAKSPHLIISTVIQSEHTEQYSKSSNDSAILRQSMIFALDLNNGQWTTMDHNGQQWTTTDINGQHLITIDNNGQQLTTMDNNG